jgi:hypothetical protein
MTGPGNVEVSVHVAASPEATFAYLTGPARYVQWMGSHANLEPVPGGTYRVQMADGFAAAAPAPAPAPPLPGSLPPATVMPGRHWWSCHSASSAARYPRPGTNGPVQPALSGGLISAVFHRALDPEATRGGCGGARTSAGRCCR